MPHSTIDIFIPDKPRRSHVGRFLTTLAGLRADARNPVPARPRVREHDAAIPPMRTPNQYKGAYVERYEEPCQCDACSAKRTGDYLGSNFAPVLRNVPPGTLPFSQVFENALDFPRVVRTTPEQWLPTQDDFKEEEHPRGQTENPGQFAEKAGGPKPKISKAAALVPAKPDRSDFPEHIKKLVLPPAWKNVHYNPDPAADLLAQGKDAKGRLQSVYSEAFAKQGAIAKFGRVSKLEKLMEHITDKNETNRKSKLPIIRDTADVTKLIMETGIRPGSDEDTKAKVKAYGATTLLGRHVQADASGVTLDYIGKDGVHLTIPITDKDTAAMVRKRAKAAGPDGKLFPSASSTKLQGYVKQLSSGEARPKDFRTYVANSTALGAIRMLPVPENETAYKKSVREVAKRVSVKLGNTPVIALASYINPAVFAHWRAACCPNLEVQT